MTSAMSVLAAFAIIMIDLAGRAGLDKVLALTGGPATVAFWAQLQSVEELVSTVAIAGVLQGLTVMVSQANGSRDQHGLLQDALRLGLVTSLVIALFAPLVGHTLTRGTIGKDLFWLAALVGCITVVPATLNAFWLGKHQQQRMFGLSLFTGAILLLVAAGAWMEFSLRELLLTQSIALFLLGAAIWRYLKKFSASSNATSTRAEYFASLLNFVPVGLAIGILSPVSVLLVRGMLSQTLSWEDVGFVQALWRSAEWVTATSAGILSLIFLPRFSSTYGTSEFNREVVRAAAMVLIPAGVLLSAIFMNQRTILAALYDAQFLVSDETAALFMLGSWVRIASWVFLFGLYAAHQTRMIIAGEVLSLPLYALLLWLFEEGMTLERTGLLYLASFLVYLSFTTITLLRSSRIQFL